MHEIIKYNNIITEIVHKIDVQDTKANTYIHKQLPSMI